MRQAKRVICSRLKSDKLPDLVLQSGEQPGLDAVPKFTYRSLPFPVHFFCLPVLDLPRTPFSKQANKYTITCCIAERYKYYKKIWGGLTKGDLSAILYGF